MAKTERIAIIGRSSVGRTLAEVIGRSPCYELATSLIAARSQNYPKIECDVLIIATRDDRISETAVKALKRCVRKPRLVVHLAGSLPSTILPEGTQRLILHPLQTFAKRSTDLLNGITWMASSEDQAAIRWAKRFTKALGAKGLIELEAEQLPLYHTLGVFAANFVVLLGGALEEVGAGLGEEAKKIKAAIRPLMMKAMENVIKSPAKEVLSGPIARKDFETIRKHQKALKSLDPELQRLYSSFIRYAKSHGY